MVRFPAIFRWLLILICLVPFSNARQVSGTVSPFVPANEAPVPISEEDDERGTDIKERLASQSRQRSPAYQRSGLLPAAPRRLSPSSQRPTSPTDPDPFHNGLGTPYRC